MPPNVPLARHAQMILCSDFLMPPKNLEGLMQRYAALQLRGVLVHVLDPAEDNFGFQGRVEMQGCEGEAPLLLPNAASVQDAYRRRLAEHKARLKHIAESAGWSYTSHVTHELPHLALMRVFRLLSTDAKTG